MKYSENQSNETFSSDIFVEAKDEINQFLKCCGIGLVFVFIVTLIFCIISNAVFVAQHSRYNSESTSNTTVSTTEYRKEKYIGGIYDASETTTETTTEATTKYQSEEITGQSVYYFTIKTKTEAETTTKKPLRETTTEGESSTTTVAEENASDSDNKPQVVGEWLDNLAEKITQKGGFFSEEN